MKYCENCGKEHNGSYGSGRFCSSKCARAFSGKINKDKLKDVVCNHCGKVIKVNKHSAKSTWLCNECKYNIETTNLNEFRTCKICGRKHLRGTICQNEFCKKHNIKQLNTLIKYFGFDKRFLGTLDVETEFYRVRDILYNLYWEEKLCGQEISDLFGYKNSHNLTQSIFKYLEIPTRNTPDKFMQNCILNGRHVIKEIYNNFKTCWHTTWNNKDVFLRSSYELDYAIELDSLKIDYDVESLRIKYFDSTQHKFRCAIPDFYLVETNTIVEIKSNWTFNKQNLKDKFAEYKKLGYNVKLILEHTEYNDIPEI